MPVEEANLKKASDNVEIRIKQALLEKGLKQVDLARKLHVYPAQINRAIKGGNDPKSIEIRMKIYRELGMNE